VRATALDAVALGFTTEVLPEAIAAVDLTPGDGARALDEMTTAGVFAVALAEP
jgi:nicotinamidase-related amidase